MKEASRETADEEMEEIRESSPSRSLTMKVT